MLVGVVLSVGVHGASGRPAAAPILVVDNSFALDSSDPQRALDPTSYIIDRAVYDTLFTYRGSDLAHPIPLLVKSWSTNAAATTYTFRLRQDVHFADGTQLTAADVVFSLRRLVNLKGNPSFLLAGFTVAAPNSSTVVIKSKAPAPQLRAILATPSTGIVNAKLARAHGATANANAAAADSSERWFNSGASAGAGSGPYELDSYEPTSQVVLRPNLRYWGTRQPRFGKIVIRNMSAASQLLNIRRGAHQIAIDLSSAQTQTLKGDKRLVISTDPSTWVFYAFTNDDPQTSSITSNTLFQQAVRKAFDYAGITALAGPGAKQAPGLVPSMIAGALPRSAALKQNAAEAKSDLARSGVGGQSVTLSYPNDLTLNGVSFTSLAQKVQANLQAVGVGVTLAGSPIATFQPAFRAGKLAFGLWAFSPPYPDPSDYLVFAPGQLVALHAGWPKGADLALEQLAARALVTAKPTARATLYRQIQLALNARGPFIPLVQPAQPFVSTSDLAGAVYNADYLVDLTLIAPK